MVGICGGSPAHWQEDRHHGGPLGPKMRIGRLAQEPVELKPGDTFVLTTDDIVGDAGKASVTFKQLPQAVKARRHALSE